MKHDTETRSCYNCIHFIAKDNGSNVKSSCDISSEKKVGAGICSSYQEQLADYEEPDDHYAPCDSWRDHFFEKAVEKLDEEGA